MLYITEMPKATGGSTAAARPMPVTTKMFTASLLSSRAVRKRTAATMPPSEKASASECFTSTTMPATITGRIRNVCTTDCW